MLKKNGIFSFFNFKKRKNFKDIKKNKEDVSKVVNDFINKKKDSSINIISIPKKNDSNTKYFSNIKTDNEKKKLLNTKKNFFSYLKEKCIKASKNFSDGIISIFFKKRIDDAIFDQLEEQLLISDISMETTNYILNKIIKNSSKENLKDAHFLYSSLKKQMFKILEKVEKPIKIDNFQYPFVILVVGVNGVGKTTTIGKLSIKYKQEGKKVALVAGDTFRAAAVDQLKTLGKLYNVPVISSSSEKEDPASIVFNAINIAISKKFEVLIIDTAGRLHSKLHLMDELKKIVRVIKKHNSHGSYEIMLVIDGCTGQNAIVQTKHFHESLGITGITITKLDGTAKGGMIFSIANIYLIPIRYICLGEKKTDLRTFKSLDFINLLFKKNDHSYISKE